jgi:hypothetical protein
MHIVVSNASLGLLVWRNGHITILVPVCGNSFAILKTMEKAV